MKGLIEFLKTSVIGGLLILLPAYISVLLLLHAVSGVLGLIQPITSHLPGGPVIAQLLSFALILGLSFATGILVRTRLGQRLHVLLERIPGYTLIRSLGRRFSGEEDGVHFAVALVELEEALVPAFLVEEHADGGFTVFVPSVPTPAAGAVYILPKERVHRVDVPLTKAVRCITHWGAGSEELMQAMQKA